jgi:hypothetical protein
MKSNTNETRREKQNSNRQKRNDAYTTDRRDGSADWRTEYDDVVTDGGTEFAIPEPGDVVHDRDSSYGDDRLLVLGVREETTAGSEYIEQIGKTVADVNPEYSPHAPVARCVYYEEVATVDPEASMDNVRSAVELDIFNSYSFPVDRLAVGDDDDPLSDAEIDAFRPIDDRGGEGE